MQLLRFPSILYFKYRARSATTPVFSRIVALIFLFNCQRWVTERLRRPIFEEEKVEEIYGEILMSAKAPKKDGKGYEYPALGHIVGLNGKIQGERKRLLYMAGY